MIRREPARRRAASRHLRPTRRALAVRHPLRKQVCHTSPVSSDRSGAASCSQRSGSFTSTASPLRGQQHGNDPLELDAHRAAHLHAEGKQHRERLRPHPPAPRSHDCPTSRPATRCARMMARRTTGCARPRNGQRTPLPVAQPVVVARETEHASARDRTPADHRAPRANRQEVAALSGRRRCHRFRRQSPLPRSPADRSDRATAPLRRRAAEAAAICAASAFSP